MAGNTGDAGRRPQRGREELAREDYHDPFAWFAGAAPARSALTFRLVLASFGLVVWSRGPAADVAGKSSDDELRRRLA